MQEPILEVVAPEEPRPPRPPPRPTPWWTLSVIVVLVTGVLLIPLMVTVVFMTVQLPRLIYGEQIGEELTRFGTPESDRAAIRVGLWGTALAFPFQALAIPGLFYLIHRTPLAELGLTRRALGRNVLLGLAVWLLLTPLVLALFWTASTGYEWLIPSGTEPHEFEKLVRGGLLPVEKGLIIFAAVVVAAVIEEMTFRGVLLRWARQEGWASDLIVALALTATLPTSGTAWQNLSQTGALKEGLHAVAPLVWGLLMLGGYTAVTARGYGPWGRVWATAFLFAAIHGAWPSPVALFVLALGLGWLAEATRSLVGPMLVHALFNGIACLQMFAPDK